jgi:hypothetical protein
MLLFLVLVLIHILHTGCAKIEMQNSGAKSLKKEKHILVNYTQRWLHTVTLPRTVTPYRDSVDGTRDHVTYQELVTR